METEAVKQLVAVGLPDCEITVTGDGSHFQATVVGEVFAGQSPVKRQQMVYATVTDQIISGELHALTIQAYTPDEWQKAQKLRVN